MTALAENHKLPSLLASDDAGKVVMVNEAGNTYVLGASQGAGSAVPLNSETDSVTASLDEASLAALETITVNTPEGWAITDAPLAAVQATATKAAGGIGVRHVATALSFNVVTTTTAPTTTTLTITLRDGASGAGVALMTWRVRVSAAMTDINVSSIQLHGLNIYGSANTAMTLEFDAGNLNTLEDVSLAGYSV